MSPVLSSPIAPTIAHLPHAPMPHVGIPAHPAATATTSAKGVVAKGVAEANELQQPPLSKDQQLAARLESTKSKFMLPAQLEFIGMLGGGALGWVTKKFGWERAQAGIAIAARAPVAALRHTTLAEALQLPANLFKEAANEASNVGGKAAGWAGAAEKRATALRKATAGIKDADGKVIEAGLEQKVAGFAKPAVTAVGDGIATFEKTGFGKAVTQQLSRFMNFRHRSVVAKHAGAIDKASEALVTESVGFGKSIKNFVTRDKPGKVEVGALKSIFDDLHAGKALEGAAKTKHLEDVVSALEKQLQGDTLKGEIKSRAGDVMKHLQKALGSAKALQTYKEATVESAGLRTMTKAMAKAVGRVPVFNALLSVGIVAGLGAVAATAHGESKEAKAAFKKLSDALSDHLDSSFLKSVKAAQKSGKHWGAAKTGMRMAGEVADGSMWMMHNGGGAAMMGAMMLPGLCEMIVPGNTMLGALEALDKNDQGKLTMKPSDRIQLLTQVIGGMESVASHGGAYNRLAKAMAGEMQERGYKYHEVVQLLGNDTKFNAFAAEVSAKQKAEADKLAAQVKAAAPAAHAAAVAKAPETHQQPKIETVPAEMRGSAANDDAPKTRIGVGANQALHQGRIDDRQRAVA